MVCKIVEIYVLHATKWLIIYGNDVHDFYTGALANHNLINALVVPCFPHTARRNEILQVTSPRHINEAESLQF